MLEEEGLPQGARDGRGLGSYGIGPKHGAETSTGPTGWVSPALGGCLQFARVTPASPPKALATARAAAVGVRAR
jgi:hypothetical protein